jgi:hypothetical protein
MQLIHILLNHFLNVAMARVGKNSICMMAFCFDITNSAFQIVLFDLYFCRKLIPEDYWVTLVLRR